MKKNMKNIGILPKLDRIERKCNAILNRLSTSRDDKSKVDSLILKMSAAAKELELMTRSDIQE